jgi:hypothetical protein
MSHSSAATAPIARNVGKLSSGALLCLQTESYDCCGRRMKLRIAGFRGARDQFERPLHVARYGQNVETLGWKFSGVAEEKYRTSEKIRPTFRVDLQHEGIGNAIQPISKRLTQYEASMPAKHVCFCFYSDMVNGGSEQKSNTSCEHGGALSSDAGPIA